MILIEGGRGPITPSYDDRGRVVDMTAPDNRSYHFDYDRAGRLIKETFTRSGKSTEYTHTYDLGGRLIHSSYNDTTYTYDGALIRRESHDDRDRFIRTFEYDARGRVHKTVFVTTVVNRHSLSRPDSRHESVYEYCAR